MPGPVQLNAEESARSADSRHVSPHSPGVAALGAAGEPSPPFQPCDDARVGGRCRLSASR